MTEPRVPSRVYPAARQDAAAAKEAVATPQTQGTAYRLAFQDMDFLLREDLRPVRFQLELLKAAAAARRGEHRLHFRDVRFGPHPRAR